MAQVIERAQLLLRAGNYSGAGNWLDESPNGVEAVFGAGISFDGEKFTIAATPDNISPWTISSPPDALRMVGDMTVVAMLTPLNWQAHGTGAAARQGLLMTHYTREYSFTFNDSGSITWYQGGLPGDLDWESFGTAGVLPTGTRQVVAGVRSGGGGTNTPVTFHINGGVEAKPDVETKQPKAGIHNLLIGMAHVRRFVGDFYGIAMFDEALSADDVTRVGHELIVPAPLVPTKRHPTIGGVTVG